MNNKKDTAKIYELGYIYKITNAVTNKIYVGKCIGDYMKRWKSHKYDFSVNIEKHNYKSYLYSSMNKYGIENFSIEPIQKLTNFTRDELSNCEIYWIKTLKTQDPSIGYNICPGGEGGPDISGDKNPQRKNPRVQSQAEKLKRSLSLKKAYQEGRHEVIRAGYPKGKKRSLEYSTADSERQKGKKQMVNDKLLIRTFVYKPFQEIFIQNGWRFDAKSYQYVKHSDLYKFDVEIPW